MHPDDRDRTIVGIRGVLQRRASPRLHMSALVLATAAIGFLASYLMLKAGLTLMAIRYPLAVAIAYAGFLGLVSVWLRRFRLHVREAKHPHGEIDIVEVPLELLSRTGSGSSGGGSEPRFGGGGDFKGAGASRSWVGISEASPPPIVIAAPRSASVSTSGGGGGGGGGFDFDGEAIVVIIPVAIIVALSLSVLLYVVYIAPILFAELLLDAGLAAGLYHRLSGIERRSWLTTAVRNTAVPAGLVAGLLAIAGAVMQGVYPEAVSIGRVVERAMEKDSDQQGAR